jgi:hypothetical protein
MKILGSFLRVQIVVFVAAILIFSCKKETSGRLTDAEERQANFISSDADAEATIVFNGLFDDVMGANLTKNEGLQTGSTGIFGVNSIGNTSIGGSTGRGDSLPSCASVTIFHLNTVGFPIKIITEFSASGCLCNDGHVRKGRIISIFTDRLSAPGAVATTSFDNFWVDSIHVEGTHKITNTSASGTTAQIYTVDIDSKLTKTNGNYSEWHNHYVLTQTDGITYPIQFAYQTYGFKIFPGSAFGKVKRNDVLVAWRAEVIEPLVKRYNCRWISKGIVRITRENLATNSPWVGQLDYSFPNSPIGGCDNRAKLTVNGNVHEITLR